MNFHKQNQAGRSMVEMLGVLAIIGVLSIGGIAGYTKAMSKWKVDKVIDQISMIRHNLMEFYANRTRYDDLQNTNDAVKIGIIPEEMIEGTDGNYQVVHAAGGYVTISVTDGHPNIKLSNLKRDAAIAIATADWGARNISINDK